MPRPVEKDAGTPSSITHVLFYVLSNSVRRSISKQNSFHHFSPTVFVAMEMTDKFHCLILNRFLSSVILPISVPRCFYIEALYSEFAKFKVSDYLNWCGQQISPSGISNGTTKTLAYVSQLILVFQRSAGSFLSFVK